MNKFKIIISIVFLAIFLTYPVNVLAAVPDYSTNVDSLVDYIEANQDTSGKITGFGGETSWTIMGLVAAGIDPATMENGGNSPLDFLVANPPADTSTTAWERDLLAITAAGENHSQSGRWDCRQKSAGNFLRDFPRYRNGNGL